MFIVHVMPYTKGKVACASDVAQMQVFRVSDSVLINFVDSVVSKKVYVSIRPAYPEDENVSVWKLIE